MVQDLRHGMKRINVEAIVLDNPKPSTVYTRFGNSAMVTNVWIADESGKIKLCLWNDQAVSFAKGDTSTDLTEVMVAMQKASLSFQAMTQVRNKLLEAYKDVMNMPV